MTPISPLKAPPLRNPGQSLDEEIQGLLDDKLMPTFWGAAAMVIAASFEWAGYLGRWPRQPILFTVIALVAVGYGVWGFFTCRNRVCRLRQGRDGERAVGQFLEGLRANGARIFHDGLGDDFNLDHVVVTPAGIFVVETKTISKHNSQARVTIAGGQVLVDGRPMQRDPLVQVRAQIDWLTFVLHESTGKRLPVFGAIVFPGWFVEPPSASERLDIWVLEPKALPAFIEKEPDRIPSADVALAAFHLSRYIRAKAAER